MEEDKTAIDFAKYRNIPKENGKENGKQNCSISNNREDSDYDDEYSPSSEKTLQQIDTANELIDMVEKFINEKSIHG